MRLRRGLLGAASALTLAGLASAAALANPGSAWATNPWTMTLAPTALVEGTATNVTVTVTDGSEMIGCVVLHVPAGFAVLSAGVSSVPAGTWTSAVSGSGPTQVTFCATADSGRLNSGAAAVFVVQAIASGGPLAAWTAAAYKGTTVYSTKLPDPAAQPSPFTIQPAPTPTPEATPTPVATPTPTATTVATASPTQAATPTSAVTASATPTEISGSTPAPTATPTVLPPGVTPGPTTPAWIAGPSDTPAASPDATPGTTSAPASSASSRAIAVAGSTPTLAPAGGEGGTQLDIGGLPAGGAVQLESQALGGVGMFAWAVPVLFMGLPGLLLVLIVALQAGFGSAFVPITRRVLGLDRRRRADATDPLG